MAGVNKQLPLFLRTISMNWELRSSGQHSTPPAGGGEGIKLTPAGDEVGRPMSMVLRWVTELDRELGG